MTALPASKQWRTPPALLRLTVQTVTGPLVIDCELISALRGMRGGE